MTGASILAFLIKHWRATAISILSAFALVQSLRLASAKDHLEVASERLKQAGDAVSALQLARKSDAASAAFSASDQAAACTQQIASARRAGRLIERIVHDPAPLAAGSTRRLVPASDLRVLLGQGTSPDVPSASVPD